MSDSLSRRDLLKSTLATGAGLAAASALTPFPAIAENYRRRVRPDAAPPDRPPRNR